MSGLLKATVQWTDALTLLEEMHLSWIHVWFWGRLEQLQEVLCGILVRMFFCLSTADVGQIF